MEEEHDILGIGYQVDEDGVILYGCRGTGKKYRDFYRNWIPKSSYKCTGEDWPWDYFVFTDPADHERLLRDYPEDVYEN
jgi:hypothetical protein